MITKQLRNATSIVALALGLAACGGSTGGGVASTPPPVVTTPTTPTTPVVTPPPVTSTNFDTTEYQRSNAAVQAKAIAAYQAGASGTGIIAAVIDSGINQNSSEFSGRISAASADVAGSRTVQDEDGHGTAVSAILLGNKNDSNIHGIAYNATLLALRADAPGTCADTSANGGCDFPDNAIARGVDRAVANGARVINMSLGGSAANATLLAALDRATAAGVVLVFSAGNDGKDNPALAQNPDAIADIGKTAAARGLVLAVGSVDSSHVISDFSNRAGNGASYYVTALGSSVRAPDHTGANFLWSGTSFSAPVVAGAVALLAQAFPTMTGQQIVDLIKRTADDLGAAGVDNIYGNGELNLQRAFQPQGAATLAGSKTPISYTNNGMTSAPMGDAGRKGVSAVIKDRYGRAFNVEFGQSFGRAPNMNSLANALDVGAQSKGAGIGPVGISIAVSGQTDFAALDRLGLAQLDREKARALAGAMVLELSKKSHLAFGVGQKAHSLVFDLQRERGAAFLMAEAARDGMGFINQPDMVLAMRHQFGKTGLSFGVERGDARIWQDDPTRLVTNRYLNKPTNQASVALDRRFGSLALDASVTRLDEKQTILGARLDFLAGQGGATSWFADAKAKLDVSKNWSIGGAWRQGYTRVGLGGLHSQTDVLKSNAWSFDVARKNLLKSGDNLALRISQPLRIAQGGLGLTLPTDYSYDSGVATFSPTRFDLSPIGRERVVEAAYSTSFFGGTISANSYWRKDPGNVQYIKDDIGFALRFARGF